jgi:hypothetical protein
MMAKNNYFTMDSMKIRNYRRFVPNIMPKIMPIKCLKFGKFILIYYSLRNKSLFCHLAKHSLTLLNTKCDKKKGN